LTLVSGGFVFSGSGPLNAASSLHDVRKNGLGDHADTVAAIEANVNASVQTFR
jgi:hypothetical protein